MYGKADSVDFDVARPMLAYKDDGDFTSKFDEQSGAVVKVLLVIVVYAAWMTDS